MHDAIPSVDFVELCPSNKTISVTSDVIKARVNWTGPFTGSKDVSTACSHSTGDYYDVGITMVTCSFSSYVHTWTCPFYIAIYPTDYFSIKQFCPMNVTQTIERETNGSHIQVFWSDFTLDQGRYNTSKSHVPGDAFPLGVTRVTYTYYGNTDYVYRLCTFYVHVIEVNTPESTTRHDYFSIKQFCPMNVTQTIERETNGSHIQVFWSDFTLDQGRYNTSKSHVPGDAFPLGVTRVTYTYYGTGLWFASIILFTTVVLVTIMFITWRRCSLNHGGDQTAEDMCSTIVADNRRVATSFQDNRTSFDEADFMHVPMKASCEAQKPSTFSPVHVEEMPIYEEPKQCQIQPKADGPTAYRYEARVDSA
ncbi:putative hyalin [Apostichopus japonicus]|uniref:Putative hyalin n=1 Tax=Stichopus japonicus TaxID=307972 RepID=A0A2G8KPE3_STIJA|nr:putative hyalin [Apostichopus japonicus]